MTDICDINTSDLPKVWYAIRTFNCQEMKVSEFLTKKGKAPFVPMTYSEKKTLEGKVKRVLIPVVHNLLFLQKDEPQREILKLLEECTTPLSILRKEGSTEFYEIPDSQMTEFRALCDPNFKNTRFITREEADTKPGKTVRVIRGPFSGMTGKLHRVNNKYFFIKTLAGLGVMLTISRWYCELVTDNLTHPSSHP